MKKFEAGKIVRLKSWQDLEPLKNKHPSIHEEMWQQCQGEFLIDVINEEGFFMLKTNEGKIWTIAPWMCETVKASESNSAETHKPELTAFTWNDILNGTN